MKSMIQKIKRKLQLEKLRPSTIEKYLEVAAKLPLSREELEDWLTSVGPYTHNLILSVLRKFIGYGFVDPELIHDLKTVSTKGHERIKTKSDLLTREDIIKLVHTARSLRDKAIIYALFDGFPRITEFLTLERKHFVFTKDFIRVTVPESKSQPRILILVESAGHVKNYLVHERGDHPGLFWFKDDPKSQDQLTEADKKRITESIRRQISRIAAKTDIKVKVSPHRIRHAGITEKLKQYKYTSVRDQAGITDETMKVYDHLISEDAENDILSSHGIIQKNNDLPVITICPYCGTRNDLLLERCTTCAKLLQLDIEKIKSDEELMIKVLEREDVQQFLIKIIKEEMQKDFSD